MKESMIQRSKTTFCYKPVKKKTSQIVVSSIDFQNKTEMSFDSLEVKLMDNDKLKQG